MHNATHEEIEKFLGSIGEMRTVVNKVVRVETTPIVKEHLASISSKQSQHWDKLHRSKFTPQEFESWVGSIPGCSACRRDFRKLIETKSPRFDDWRRWTWEIHNAVNAKLSKPDFTWEEFEAKY